MWVSHIPVPVRAHASEHADDDFAGYKDLSELTDWNLYSLQLGSRITGWKMAGAARQGLIRIMPVWSVR